MRKFFRDSWFVSMNARTYDGTYSVTPDFGFVSKLKATVLSGSSQLS
jgi:hypothetical protein